MHLKILHILLHIARANDTNTHTQVLSESVLVLSKSTVSVISIMNQTVVSDFAIIT